LDFSAIQIYSTKFNHGKVERFLPRGADPISTPTAHIAGAAAGHPHGHHCGEGEQARQCCNKMGHSVDHFYDHFHPWGVRCTTDKTDETRREFIQSIAITAANQRAQRIRVHHMESQCEFSRFYHHLGASNCKLWEH